MRHARRELGRISQTRARSHYCALQRDPAAIDVDLSDSIAVISGDTASPDDIGYFAHPRIVQQL